MRCKESAVYLGGLISADGSPRAELSRRMGEAWRRLIDLEQVWKHAGISKWRKQELFQALVETKLMYGLDSLWLRKADRARLDSFQIKCLRRVHGIRHAYWSRVSNDRLMAIAQAKPLTSKLLQRQLLLYGRLARMPDTAVQRQALLERGSVRPRSCIGKRSRGRPRQEWGTSVFRHAFHMTGSATNLAVAVSEPSF